MKKMRFMSQFINKTWETIDINGSVDIDIISYDSIWLRNVSDEVLYYRRVQDSVPAE